MWIARDKNGRLNLWSCKPYRVSPPTNIPSEPIPTIWDNGGFSIPLSKNKWEELTWEDEPMEVNIIPTKELLSTQKELNDVYHELINYKTAVIQLQNNMKSLDGDISKWIDENFWDLIG